MSQRRPSFRDAAARVANQHGEALLEAVVSSGGFGIYIDEPTAGCIFASDETLHQFGATWEQFRGFGWARFVLAEDAERLQSAIATYEEEKGTIDVTYRIRRGEEIRWIHARVRAIVDDDGNHVGSIGVTRDNTTEQAFKLRAAQAQKMQAIGQLAARLAHDYNNLLTAMIGGVELAQEEVRSASGREHLATVHLAFDQARQLTHQLLTLTRHHATSDNVVEVDTEFLRILPLLRSTLGEVIEVEHELDAADCFVPLDASQFTQVLVNLASNARDAMNARGLLRVHTVAERDWVRIHVEDCGPGMTDQVLQRACDPFFTTKEVGRGSGFGLATVRDLVELAGGRVEFENLASGGLRASVVLPSVGPNLYPRERPQNPQDAVHSGTVLLVEDNDAVRQSVGYALAMAGYEISAARDLTEARAGLRNPDAHYDVLVTDVLLPDGEGTELAQQLRNRWATIPIVLVSGFTGVANVGAMMTDPHVAFVAKPFRAHEILEAILRARGGAPCSASQSIQRESAGG